MKKVLFFMLVLLFAVPAIAQESVWFNGSFEEAQKAAERDNKLIVVDFYSDG